MSDQRGSEDAGFLLRIYQPNQECAQEVDHHPAPTADARWSGSYLPQIVHFPLVSDPGTEMIYSNLTSDWLGMIVDRACETDLTQEHLFSPIGVQVGVRTQDRDGYYIDHREIHFTARDMAKFGRLYLNEGEYNRNQILSEAWVRDSLRTYSEDAMDLGMAILMAVLILMVYLSLTLPNKANRWVNIILAPFFFVFNLIGLPTYPSLYDQFLTVVGLVFNILTVWYAWKWLKQKA